MRVKDNVSVLFIIIYKVIHMGWKGWVKNSFIVTKEVIHIYFLYKIPTSIWLDFLLLSHEHKRLWKNLNIYENLNATYLKNLNMLKLVKFMCSYHFWKKYLEYFLWIYLRTWIHINLCTNIYVANK